MSLLSHEWMSNSVDITATWSLELMPNSRWTLCKLLHKRTLVRVDLEFSSWQMFGLVLSVCCQLQLMQIWLVKLNKHSSMRQPVVFWQRITSWDGPWFCPNQASAVELVAGWQHSKMHSQFQFCLMESGKQGKFCTSLTAIFLCHHQQEQNVDDWRDAWQKLACF